MTHYTEQTIEQTNGHTLHFLGKQIACVTSRREESERWTELRVLHTDTDKYIAVSVGGTVFPHEETRVRARVCDSLEEIADFFDFSNLAKELYTVLDLKLIKRI